MPSLPAPAPLVTLFDDIARRMIITVTRTPRGLWLPDPHERGRQWSPMITLAALALHAAGLAREFRQSDPARSLKLWLTWLDGPNWNAIRRVIRERIAGHPLHEIPRRLEALLNPGPTLNLQLGPEGHFTTAMGPPNEVWLHPVLNDKLDELDRLCRALRSEQFADARAERIIVSGLWKERRRRICPDVWVPGGVVVDYAAETAAPTGGNRRYTACLVTPQTDDPPAIAPQPAAPLASTEAEPGEAMPQSSPGRRQRGPEPGTANPVRRKREAMVRRLQRQRRAGERRSETLDRVIAREKRFAFPGNGTDKYEREQLLRVWRDLELPGK